MKVIFFCKLYLRVKHYAILTLPRITLDLITVTFGGQEQLAAEGKRRKMEDILRLFVKNTGARHSRIPD